MSDVEPITQTLIDLGRLTGSRLTVLQVRIPEVERTDAIESISHEVYELGTARITDEDIKTGKKFVVGTTTNPKSHTPITIDPDTFSDAFNSIFGNGDSEKALRAREFIKLYQHVPLHLITWWFSIPQNPSEEPIVFPSNENYPTASTQLYRYIEGNTALSVQVLDALLQKLYPGSSSLPLYERIRIYGVFGNTPPNEQAALGLNRGPQSNPYGHLHVAALPPNVLEEYAEKKRQIAPKGILKHMSPFDSLFFTYSSDVVLRKLQQKGILVSTVSDHSKDTESGRVSFLDGYNVHFTQPTSLQKSMEIISDVVNEASPVYNTLLSKYKEYYQNLADPASKERVSLECLEVLQRYGFEKEEAKKLQQAAFSLAPTYSQINTWMSELGDGQNKDELSNIKEKYDRQKEFLKTHRRREVIKTIKKRFNLNGQQAKQLLFLMSDRLKDTQKGKMATSTMPGKLSGGYTFTYTMDNGQLEVSNITFATRFSQKNIYEDIVGYMLVRD